MSEQKNYTDQLIKQIVETWTGRNKAFSDFFNKYSDEDYLSEVAPGRNRAIYLLGHLIATNDGMLPLFGLGERLFPELEVFSGNPDRSFEMTSSVQELKTKWVSLTATLTTHFAKMSAEDWMGKHTAVSAEDFAKEPHRNKLNVLLGRTNHQSYHLGQLNLMTVTELV
ncbi:hypothetical protein CNR22_13945 [Sphingobacteriaceae bacterium]|nr:hypothetical protein CNR22_13945 [Sphingobacteriaceae bacterium]